MSRQEKRDARLADRLERFASEKYSKAQNRRLLLGSELAKLGYPRKGSIINVPFAYRQQKSEWDRLRAQRANPVNTGMLPWQPMSNERLDLWPK